MDEEKIPSHLSADEHSLLELEEQLLKDGHQWLKRAAGLYTQTSKIKIWVPVVCSAILTGYYIYLMHNNAPVQAHVTPPAVQSAPVAVPEPSTPSDQQSGPKPSVPPGSTPDFSVVSVAPNADASEAELLKDAQDARQGQRFGDEASYLEKILEHSPSTPEVCPALGKAYERAGKIDASIKAFQRCAAQDPNNLDTLVAFAHVLLVKPDLDRASEMYRKCLRKDPGNLDAANGLALVELKQNHLPAASQAAEMVLRKVPDNTDALLIAGIVAWRQFKLPEAEKIFMKGLDLDDRRADFHGFLGRVEEAERHPQEALQQYEKALSLDPNDSDIAGRRDRLRDSK